MSNLFVTGAYRSGTTLVEKLLSMHPDVHVAAQPFPYLYVNLKRRFLNRLGADDPYPLGTLFRETRYDAATWLTFLQREEIGEQDIRAWALDQRGYSGAMTPELQERASDLVAGVFLDVHTQVQRWLAGSGVTVAASKEILCEEYTDLLVAAGHHVVLVVRDPRSMVASLARGEGSRYAGGPRPTLLHVRNWRKSVAFVLAHVGSPRATVARYEDVVQDPYGWLSSVAEQLGLRPPPDGLLSDGLRDQEGELWAANSSFGAETGEIHVAGTRRHEHHLSAATTAYIETAALPEMLAMGYQPDVANGFDPDHLARFREPAPITRLEVRPDLSTAPEELAAEIERLEMLRHEHVSDDEKAAWFIRPAAFDALRDVLSRLDGAPAQR